MSLKKQTKATKLSSNALSMFDSAVQDLKFANTLHAEVEQESITEARRLERVAEESRVARERNEVVASRILALVSGDADADEA